MTSGNQNKSRKVFMCGPLSSACWEIILSAGMLLYLPTRLFPNATVIWK